MTRSLVGAALLLSILFSTHSLADPNCADANKSDTTKSLCKSMEASTELIKKSALLWQYASNDMKNTSACPPGRFLAAYERLQNSIAFRRDALCDVNLLVAGGHGRSRLFCGTSLLP